MSNYKTLKNTWNNSVNNPLPEQQYITISSENNKNGLITIGTNPTWDNQNCRGFSNFTGNPSDSTDGITYAINNTGGKGVLSCTVNKASGIGEIKCWDLPPGETGAKQIACCDSGQPIIKQKGDSSGPKGVLNDTSLPQCISKDSPITYYMCSKNKQCIPAPAGTDPKLLYIQPDCDKECDLTNSKTNFWVGADTTYGNKEVLTKNTCDLINQPNGCNDINTSLRDNGSRVLKTGCGIGAECSNWTGMWTDGNGVQVQYWDSPEWPATVAITKKCMWRSWKWNWSIDYWKR